MRRWLFLQLTQVLLFLSDCFRRHLLGYIKSLDGRRVDVGLDPSPFPVRLGDGVYCTGERDTDPEAASFRFSYGHIPIQGCSPHAESCCLLWPTDLNPVDFPVLPMSRTSRGSCDES